MQCSTAEWVDRIFSRGWDLRDGLRKATATEVDEAQQELKDLLSRITAAEANEGGEGFLGSAYPLVCWIDYLMTTTDPRVSRLWSGRELEFELFGTRQRDSMFWRQAERAESLGRRDALKIFFLCVAHGFTGGRFTGRCRSAEGDSAESLQAWMERVRALLSEVPAPDLPYAHRLAAPPDVSPLHGRQAWRSMLGVAWIATLILLPTLSYWGTRLWMLAR